MTNFYEGKMVLVAGASGLIGGHAVRELLRRGAKVVATVHRSPPAVEDPRIEYRRVDLTKASDCEAAVWGCQFVILAAANTSGAMAMRDNPVAHVTENLLINSQTLEASWRAGVERVLYVSSSTVYPLLDHPRKEDEGFLGDPYPVYFGVGWMKRYTEKMCAFYQQRFGMKAAIIRPTNVYGPGDKFDPERSHVLPALIRRAVDGEDPLEVWGDGSATRDFIYVSDLVDALLLTLERETTGSPVNIGSGRLTPIRECFDLVLKLTGRRETRVAYAADMPTTIPKQWVDVSRARQILGFEPRVTLEEGLARTIEWYRNQAPASRKGPA